MREDYLLAVRAGIAKTTIKKALREDEPEKGLFRFLYGDLDAICKKLPEPSSLQSWETTGKRLVHLEEARFVVQHLLRNGLRIENNRALVLSGLNPALGCLPWAISGIADSFDAYENKLAPYLSVKSRIEQEVEKIRRLVPASRKIEFNLLWGNCLNSRDRKYGVIDLDFCSNQLKQPVSRNKILTFIEKVAPETGPFVFRTTLHIGRTGNSKKDVEQHIESFDRKLRKGSNSLKGFKIRAYDQKPYQSSLPMVSLIWVLERKEVKLVKHTMSLGMGL